LFSEGIGGNNVDFLVKYFKNSVSDVLKWASEQNFSSFHQQAFFLNQKNYAITSISEIQNWNLKKYMAERGFSPKVYPFIKEVHFTMNQKKMYAIGFENRSKGWELRNSFYKGAFFKKDISLIKNSRSEIAVFEGFMDALSYIELKKEVTKDLLVLNSISMVEKSIVELKKYDKISLFLDNDLSGQKTSLKLQNEFPNAENISSTYYPFKDLGDYLKHRMKT
jgi:5S rRNA maturation endonuclease (ribonuclease M5)